MANQQDFRVTRGDDTPLVITIQPPLILDGRSFEWQVSKRFGGSGLIVKSVASGFFGASGITFISGTGNANITISAADSSGLPDAPYNYAHEGGFTDTGASKRVVEGYIILEG